MGQGLSCNCNYNPRRKNTHRPTNPQPSHEPPRPAPHYSTRHTEARSPVEIKWTNPRNNEKTKTTTKTEKEGETLTQESGGREGNQEKRSATGTPRHANKASSTTQTQRRHMACVYTKATYRWTVICPPPPCSRTMVNATNANIVTQTRYRRPTRHQRTPKTLETIAPSR